MAIIACSECGRAVSDKAAVCVGCGAPLNPSSGIDLVPKRSQAPPPTREQITRRVLIAASMLLLGVAGAIFLDHRPGDNRLAEFVSAMLIIGGLSGCLVLLVLAAVTRR